MPWRGPEYPGEFPTLGWGVIDLCTTYARLPNGAPLVPTVRQQKFIARLYRLDPATGRFVYRRAVDEGAKGVGKSPEGCMIGLGELVGDVVFDGWDANGNPVGRPRWTSEFPALIQVCANAEDQTDNLYGFFRQMLSESPALDEFGIDLGKTRIELTTHPGKMEGVTTAAGTREGQRVTCALLEETQHYTERNGGIGAAETLQRNVGKTAGRMVALTNAPLIGQDSLAERDLEAAKKGTAGLLYFAHRGPFVEDLTDREVLRAALEVAYASDPDDLSAGPVDYVDLDRLCDEAVDMRPGQARRFFLNIPDETADESWLPDGLWEELREEGAALDQERPFRAAVDMALKHDTTAVRTCQSWDDGRVFVGSRVFTPTNGDHLDVFEIEQHIRELHQTGNLVECGYDPAYFERSAQVLLDEGVNMVEFPQSAARMVPACGHAYELAVGRRIVHDDDPVSAAQVVAAAPFSSGEGWRLSKGRDKRKKIDSAIAMVMAIDLETVVAFEVDLLSQIL